MTLPARAFLARRILQRNPHLLTRRPQSTNHNPKLQPNTNPNPSQHTSPNLPLTDSKSIPGPIWLWTQPLNSYSRVHARRPYTVQIISTLIIYFFGDMAAQSINPSPPKEDEEAGSTFASTYDLQRTMRALLIGGFAAIPGYHWFLYLARNFNYASKTGSIVLKVLINQVVFTPIFNSYFFGMQSALSGASVPDIVERIKRTVPTSWKNSWKIWPAVTAFSFAFIRVELRGLFAGVIAIGWQTYLSILNQRAARMEKEDQELAHDGIEDQRKFEA